MPKQTIKGQFSPVTLEQARLVSKGGKFLKFCGAASVGECDKVIWFYQLSSQCNLGTVKSFKADVLNISSFSDTLRKS